MEDDFEFLGDPRYCPRHRDVKVSSDDGMFDAPCGKCEYEMDQAAEEWEHNPENPKRRYCGGETDPYLLWPLPPWVTTACVPDEEDNIPF